MQLPLSTLGNKIVDTSGSQVLLRGINWFGFETSNFVVHGLWTRDYKDMFRQIASLGYNCIRLPFCNQLFNAGITANGIDFSTGKNTDLQGVNGLALMDKIVQAAIAQGLMIILDRHRPDSSGQTPLWYTDAYPESRWISDWQMLATHYLNTPQVIGADLHNEPHGQASWGDGNTQTDWRLAATRCGNAIHEKNPNWLIFIEGIESNVQGTNISPCFWGSNLSGVAQYPVKLNKINKVVYSPHDYGQEVSNQSYFSDPNYPANMAKIWEDRWNYINTQNLAPVLIGEWGGIDIASTSSSEGKWAHALVDFISKNKLNFTYWCWNPNSGDTGGILNNDWTTINQGKQNLLQPLLTQSVSPSPSPTPSVTPAPSGTPKPSPSPTPSQNPSPSPSSTPSPSPIPSPSPTPSSSPSPSQSPTPTPGQSKAVVEFSSATFDTNKLTDSQIVIRLKRTGTTNIPCRVNLNLTKSISQPNTAAYNLSLPIDFAVGQTSITKTVDIVSTGNTMEFVELELTSFTKCIPGKQYKGMLRLFSA